MQVLLYCTEGDVTVNGSSGKRNQGYFQNSKRSKYLIKRFLRLLYERTFTVNVRKMKTNDKSRTLI